MATRKITTVLFFCVFLLLLSSCNSTNQKQPVEFVNENINKQILLRAPSFGNTYKTNEVILLEVKNNTSSTVIFPYTYNVTIFEKIDGKWEPVNEKPTQIFPQSDVELSQDSSLISVVYVFPELPDLNKVYKLRIYVIGKMKENEGFVDVAAYVDVKLHP